MVEVLPYPRRSAALSFALRALGLRAISSSLGLSGLRVRIVSSDRAPQPPDLKTATRAQRNLLVDSKQPEEPPNTTSAPAGDSPERASPAEVKP